MCCDVHLLLRLMLCCAVRLLCMMMTLRVDDDLNLFDPVSFFIFRPAQVTYIFR